MPLTVRAAGADGEVVRQRVLLDGPSTEVAFDTPIRADSLVINESAAGFYRAGFDADQARRAAATALTSRSTAERFAFLDDTWTQVIRGELDAATYLSLLESFADEPETVVWHRIVAGLGALDRLADDRTRPALMERTRALLRPALEVVGPDPRIDDDDLTLERRGLLFSALGATADDPSTIERATTLHRRYLDDHASVDPSLVSAALNVVAAHADTSTYDLLVERFRSAEGPQEMLRYLYALTAPNDADLTARTRELTLTDNIRTQNAPYVLGRLLGHRTAGPATWAFVRDRWDDITDRFPSNSLARMLEGVRSISHPETADDIVAFFEEHPLPQAGQTLAQHLERMAVTVRLTQRERPRLGAALAVT